MRKYPPTAISENVIKNISSQSLNVRNGERAYDNSTPNTDTNQDILFQGGADRGMFSREHNLIALLKNADASIFVHELGHFFLETNTRIARDLTAKRNDLLDDAVREGEGVLRVEVLIVSSAIVLGHRKFCSRVILSCGRHKPPLAREATFGELDIACGILTLCRLHPVRAACVSHIPRPLSEGGDSRF